MSINGMSATLSNSLALLVDSKFSPPVPKPVKSVPVKSIKKLTKSEMVFRLHLLGDVLTAIELANIPAKRRDDLSHQCKCEIIEIINELVKFL